MPHRKCLIKIHYQALLQARLKKICDCQKRLENEISHYRHVLKKYKKGKGCHPLNICFHYRFTAAMLSAGGVAVSLSGIGAVADEPLAGVAGFFGLVLNVFTVGGRRFDKKISKHEQTVALAEAKHISISRLVSKVLNDGLISEVEFNLILRKAEQYQSLKNQIRNAPASRSKAHDVEALKEEIENEYRKKLRSLLNIKQH